MRKLGLSSALAFTLVSLSGGSAWANGFAIFEHDATGAGRAGAMTARPNNASAFFNPAGIAMQKGLSAEIGFAAINFESTATMPDGQQFSTDNPMFLLPHLYASYVLEDVAGLGDIGGGIGIFPQFGLSLDWPDEWPGNSVLQKIDLQTVTINPSLSWRFTPRVSVGLGFQVVLGAVELQRRQPLDGVNTADVQLGGEATGFSFNAGLYVQPTDKVHLGFHYRHRVDLDFEGDADIQPGPGTPGGIRAILPNQGVSTSVALPAVVSAGLGYDLLPNLNIEVDVNYLTWGDLKGFDIDFERPETPDETTELAWEDAMILRFGGTYEVMENLPVHLGYVFAFNPIPDRTLSPLLPDSDRHLFTVGLGYEIFGVNATVAYNYVLLNDREVYTSSKELSAAYESEAHLIGVSLGYNLE